MTGTPNPVDQITGLTNTSNVAKGDFTTWAKSHVAQVLADAADVNGRSLTNQLMIVLKANGRLYNADTSDTTTADDGLTCIRDANGLAFKISTIDGIDGIDGASALTRVRVVAASNVNLATGLASGQTIDGVTLATNDLVLVAGQATASQNGVYVVPATGAASRDGSFSQYDQHPGTFFSVEEGTTYHDTLWQCTSDKGGTLGTTAIAMSQFGVIPIDTDATLAANSDTRIPSQKAVKSFVLANSTALSNVITPEAFGAKGDGVVNASGGAINVSVNNKSFTQTGYTFVAADVGKYIAIDGAGAGGATLATTIASISAGAAILTAAASTTVTNAANEWGTNDDAALVALANASAGKSIWFGAGKIYFRSGSLMLYPVGPFTIYGNRATIKCMATAPSSTYGFMFTDAPFTGGPSDYTVRDLIYDGNRTRRVSTGAISAAVYSETGFYSINGKDFSFYDCIARNTTCDGFFTGGQSSIGNNCQDFSYTGCKADNAGRNGYSIGGASYGDFVGCVSQNHSFGAGHSNISVGWDYEPSGVNYGNANIKMLGCIASSCTHVGFNSQAGGASNDGLAWGFCRAEACGIGFQTDNSAGTKVTAAEYAGNTTNFAGLSEKISGY